MNVIWCILNVRYSTDDAGGNTGRFIMFSVITNVYNKKTKGPTLMELFTVIGKLIFFLHPEMFDVCTTGDTAHIDTIFKFLPHTRLKSFGVLVINVCNHGEHYETPCIYLAERQFKMSQ